MIIGIDGFRLTGKKTGKESFVRNLINPLLLIETSDKYVLFVRCKTGINYPSNVTEVVIKDYQSYTFWNQLVMPFWVRKYKIDLMIYLESMLPVFSSVPSILFVLDLSFIVVRNDFNKKAAFILKTFIKHSVRKACKIIAISKSTKDDIVKMLEQRSNTIEVIYPVLNDNNLDNNSSNQEKIELFNKFSVVGNYIITIGSTYKYKNIQKLIQAFNILEKEGYKDNLQLVIVGTKTDKVEGMDLEVASGKSLPIVFTGYLSDRELSIFLSNASVFVFPSLYEGFGIPVLEAMAFGIPVAASNVSSLPEVVGDAGITFDPLSETDIADKIRTLLSNKTLSAAYIKKGYLRLQAFDKEKEAYKLKKLIESCINVN